MLFLFQSSGEEYDYEIDASVKISREGVISIAGTTKLPDESVFAVTLSYGKNNPVLVARKSATVAGAKFAAEFNPFKERVFPGTYTIEVLFDRYAQPAKVANALGTYLQNWSKRFTVTSGAEEEAGKIKTALKEELFNRAKDLDDLRKDVDTEFRKAIKDVAASGFASKKAAWQSKVSDVMQKMSDNALMYNITKISSASDCVATLADILNKIIGASDRALGSAKGAANVLNRIDNIHALFALKYGDAMSALGMTAGQEENLNALLAAISKKWLEFSQTDDKEKWQVEFACLTMELANSAPNLLDKEALELGECGNAIINNSADSEKSFSVIIARISEKINPKTQAPNNK